MEWHLQLPVHHYIHVVAGIAEFAFLTTAAIMAMQRARRDGAPSARLYTWVVRGLFVSYPLLGAVYLTDRLGTLIEPVFFVLFCTMLLAEVFEPLGSGSPAAGSPSDSREPVAVGAVRAGTGR
jgi:branched-subunit amino acid permease